MNKIKIFLQKFNRRFAQAENRINDPEDGQLKPSTMRSRKIKRMHKNEQSLTHLWYRIKCTSLYILGVPEEGKQREGLKNFK